MLFCIAQNSPDLKIKWMENSQVYIGIIFIITQFSIPKKREEMLEQKKNKLIQMGSPRIIVRYFYQIS